MIRETTHWGLRDCDRECVSRTCSAPLLAPKLVACFSISRMQINASAVDDPIRKHVGRRYHSEGQANQFKIAFDVANRPKRPEKDHSTEIKQSRTLIKCIAQEFLLNSIEVCLSCIHLKSLCIRHVTVNILQLSCATLPFTFNSDRATFRQLFIA